jgi:sulfotransferase 6B1
MIKKLRQSLKPRYQFGRLIADGLFARLAGRSNHADWPHLLFVVGLPKSGTTWLAQLLQLVPGYKPAVVYDPDDCSYRHDICDDIFAHLPHNVHYVMKLHTHYSPANMQVLDRFDLRPVIMYRDLRDQCVSRYFHVLNDPAHRHHAQYNSASRDEGLTHSLNITLDYYMRWVEDWRAIMLEQQTRFLEVKYETLRQDPGSTLSQVAAFFKLDLSRDQIEMMVERIASQTRFDIKENLQQKQRNSSARKGIVGDWRNHFTEGHVVMVKEKCGQHLVDLGYERDLNWTL